MARFDGNLKAAGETGLDIDELLSAFGRVGETNGRGRQDAMACFLSASEGWEDAKAALRGAFAAASKAPWLKGGKE